MCAICVRDSGTTPLHFIQGWPTAHLRRATKLVKDSNECRPSVCIYRETVGELNCLQGCYLQTVRYGKTALYKEG